MNAFKSLSDIRYSRSRIMIVSMDINYLSVLPANYCEQTYDPPNHVNIFPMIIIIIDNF